VSARSTGFGFVGFYQGVSAMRDKGNRRGTIVIEAWLIFWGVVGVLGTIEGFLQPGERAIEWATGEDVWFEGKPADFNPWWGDKPKPPTVE
jgi:hypothetical protein